MILTRRGMLGLGGGAAVLLLRPPAQAATR